MQIGIDIEFVNLIRTMGKELVFPIYNQYPISADKDVAHISANAIADLASISIYNTLQKYVVNAHDLTYEIIRKLV